MEAQLSMGPGGQKWDLEVAQNLNQYFNIL